MAGLAAAESDVDVDGAGKVAGAGSTRPPMVITKRMTMPVTFVAQGIDEPGGMGYGLFRRKVINHLEEHPPQRQRLKITAVSRTATPRKPATKTSAGSPSDHHASHE